MVTITDRHEDREVEPKAEDRNLQCQLTLILLLLSLLLIILMVSWLSIYDDKIQIINRLIYC